ncbi:Mitochondrial zinc maintenance protein 1, mitochondrial [Vanrija pseudolonga]|uniref:Mitochondrial zinc maintenance protein 1, mitochondrial n=1 Tax=Vanrija pseudolonga TaxID=143232 RepID=A0AAF0Y384_9TREE|nr:Mitochondrial zinc maintenance protein 1, mitochondrial [Vanrija pseudolonga]
MSAFPQALKPAARSAYRAVLRASRQTFHADPARHSAMVTTARGVFASPTLTGDKPPPPPLEGPAPDLSSEAELAKRIQEWNEVALFLRRNVVQGRLDESSGTYKLRVTHDTEIGDNEDIKKPAVLPVTPFPNRGKRRRGQAAQEQPKCGEA